MLRRHATRAIVTATTAAALAAAFAVQPAHAVQPPVTGADATDSVDVRRAADRVSPTEAQLTATSRLVADAKTRPRVSWDRRFGTPRSIYPLHGTLTGPHDGTPAQVARHWLTGHRAAFGLSAADVDALEVAAVHRLKSGSHVVDLRQTAGDVPAVHGGSMSVTVRQNGAVESYAGQTGRATRLRGGWDLSAGDALGRVAGTLAPKVDFTADRTGERAGFSTFARGPFAAGSYVRKAAFVTSDGTVPAFQVLFVKSLDQAWDVMVDARDGSVLRRASVVQHESVGDSEGTVYPNHPGAATGGQPVVRSFGPTAASPSGWVDPTGVAGLPGPTTLGNNASAAANWSNYLVPADQAPRPVSATSRFHYPYRANWAKTGCQAVPPAYASDLNPAATNLFYHHNRVHDELYGYGFTEEDGNFQVNNGDRGGDGHDPVLGLVQAGALSGGEPLYTGRDNAYMLTLPDGIPAWSGMFLWEPIEDSFEGPCRDGDFDATVIEHEYAHGLSNRYVSAEDNALNAHQSGSMGEGWGDWYGLNYLHRAGLSDNGVVGAYATGNAERGIRNWDYDDNPTTFADIGYDLGGAEVHADGEIWTTMLWNYRKALVREFGQAKGSRIAALTVTEAMPRSPADPSFLDMRDAIATAIDDLYHDSAPYEKVSDLFWTTFAKRGAGLHAQSDGGADLDPTPAFDHPDAARNGRLVGTVVNGATGKPVRDARVMLGVFEAGSSALRTTGTSGAFAAPVVAGTYPVTVQAPGFGAHTFRGVHVRAGEDERLTLTLTPNLASAANGAKVVSATSEGAKALVDDTERGSWTSDRRGHAVIELAKAAKVTSVQVSAFTTSRFEGLRDFTLQTSTDGRTWHDAVVRKNAFDYAKPRPVAPDLHYRTFELASPVQAKYVRFYADAPLGETKTVVQTADVQVYGADVTGLDPLPPAPPDDPVKDTGTIVAGNPASQEGLGVTMTDLQNTCKAPPASQGTDAWVTTLPESFGDGAHRVKATGDSPAPYDLDLYFLNAKCEQVGAAASAAADESGTIPSGTRYVVTSLWLGAHVPVTVEATDPG